MARPRSAASPCVRLLARAKARPCKPSCGHTTCAFVAPSPCATIPSISGKIERLTRVGGYVKVYVSLPSGESVVVLMSKGDLDALHVEPGDPVAVDVVDAKVFVQSYSI